jgi:multidrug efflux pump subunit AcrA (membrane-fusion protein)
MWLRGSTAVVTALACVMAVGAWAQAPNGSSGTQTARVETAPLDLLPPERYQVPVVLEPNRRVAVMATADGVLRALAVALGATVREGQELGQLDRTEASARLKIAQAQVKEVQAEFASKTGHDAEIGKARVEAAQGRAELAQLDVDRCTLRAPFAGRVLALPVSPGQYVTKGTMIADLADVSTLRALMPVDRSTVKEGGTLEISVEGKAVAGKVQAVLPLPEHHAHLRELATRWEAAWLAIVSSDRGLEPGQRVSDPFVPDAPITVVASRAVHDLQSGAGQATVLVVRSDYVTLVPVRVLGNVGPERVQVSGPFRATDLAIVESSIPLAAGTYIRFGSNPDAPIETVPPKPGAPGRVVDITPPTGGAAPPGTAASRITPIGAPDSNAPRAGSRTAKSGAKPAAKGAAKAATSGGGSAVPF